MSACVFLGPSLPVATAREALDAIYFPPAGHGDIYRATLRRPKPRVIGLIDGYFRHRPAVRHKEILWAMSQGIHVYGAASIGALRAVELSDFGMVGVGSVFADYAQHRLRDDDEVAVDHGPMELGYPPLNDTLVDIRATLEQARKQGVIGIKCQDTLIAIAKQTFYVRRTYPQLIEAALQQGSDPGELARLNAWLPAGKVNQKQQDALALLEAVRSFLASDRPALTVAYHFERTETWDADVAFATPLQSTMEAGTLVHREHLLDEVRLRPDELTGLRSEAFNIALARRQADRARIAVSPDEIREFRQRWLCRRNLLDAAALASWCSENHLEGAAFDDFIAARAREHKLAAMAGDIVDDCMADALRARGHYAPLANRALEKERTLADAGAADMSLAASGITALDLLIWFCRNRLQSAVPTDVEQFAADLSFASAEALYRALLRERLYAELTDKADGATGL